MACITCGKGFSGDQKALISALKDTGVKRWVFIMPDGKIKLSKNFITGWKEYFHIEEWNPEQ
jgi:hypothetical protein